MSFFRPNRDGPDDPDDSDDSDEEDDAWDEDDPDTLPEPSSELEPETPIVETSTIEHATVKIHAHPWQQPVDIITDSLDIQVLASSVTLNGVSFENPDRALTVPDARVTHNPRSDEVTILTHSH